LLPSLAQGLWRPSFDEPASLWPGIKLQHVDDLRLQRGKIDLNRSPNEDRTYEKVTIRQRVSHRIGRLEWQFRMPFAELAVQLENVVCRFANNFNVSYDRILQKLACQEHVLIDTSRVEFDLADRFENMPQVVSKP